MTFKVYLAGPISGLTYGEGQDWRSYVKAKLWKWDIEGYSPLRCKDYLSGAGVLEQSYEETPLSTDRGIMTRDFNDCQTADLIFVNFIGAAPGRVSIGTVMEIAWGYSMRKPVVCVMDKTGDLHDHPMIREALGFRFTNLDQAIAATRAILLP
jgi:nucleoside 2-deoxyribosyltransferase